MNYARDIEVRRMIRERMERMEDIARAEHYSEVDQRANYEASQQIQLSLFPRSVA